MSKVAQELYFKNTVVIIIGYDGIINRVMQFSNGTNHRVITHYSSLN